MKKLLIIILFTEFLCGATVAQDNPSPRFHEFGIFFSSFDNFGLRYKYGNEKTRLRLSLLSMNLSSMDNSSDNNYYSTNKTTGYGAGIGIGFDNRISLYKNFSLLLGAELGLSYNYSHQTLKGSSDTLMHETKSKIFSPAISFLFGINYVVKDHLVLGAEINPTLSYNMRIEQRLNPTEYKDKVNSIMFSLLNTGAGLYIAYRFGK